MMNQETSLFTPSQVSGYIKSWMDRDRLLTRLLVQGELSNYKIYPSGHHYFTLKDTEGALRCVMFRGEAASLRFRPQNGMQVTAAGRVSVFPRDGQYQLYCTRLTLEGTGDLHVAFEQRKEKLFQQGLFDTSHKKPLPAMPKRIALVTSPAGAAVRDMLRILKARFPVAQVLVVPTRVQGEEAAQEIAAAIQWVNLWQAADLIITGRGGGSMEDLWAFNEEVVAWAIYHSEIPVISAVGHEPDVTISDFVADLRAATPSNAAEMAVPDQNELLAWLEEAEIRMAQGLKRLLSQRRRDLDRLRRSRPIAQPETLFQEKRQRVDVQGQRFAQAMNKILSEDHSRVSRLAASLDAMSPMKVLGRGYSIAQKDDGQVIASIRDVGPGEKFALNLSDGTLPCQVEEQN